MVGIRLLFPFGAFRPAYFQGRLLLVSGRVPTSISPCVRYKAKAKTVARRKTIGNYEQMYGLDTVVVSRGFAMFRAREQDFQAESSQNLRWSWNPCDSEILRAPS